LARARRKDAWHCPLALACQEQLGDEWAIQPPTAYRVVANLYRYACPLSAQAQALVEAWDRGEAVEPQTLPLDDPTAARRPGSRNVTL
jgi:hypothetical protein